jgi:hypothetical protein
MSIQMNPANTAHPQDFQNYMREFDKPNNDEAKDEIKKQLNKVSSTKYPFPITDAKCKTFEAYEDFALGSSGRGRADKRLGGTLDYPYPISQAFAKELSDLPEPIPDANNNNDIQFAFPRGHNFPGNGTVTVRGGDGAILHTVPPVAPGANLEATVEYMHHRFDKVLYLSRDHLEKINEALAEYTENPTPGKRTVYENAVRQFEDLVASLQPRLPDGKGPFDWVTVTPLVTAEGYIVSARIEVHWKNPYHSSSTIRVP